MLLSVTAFAACSFVSSAQSTKHEMDSLRNSFLQYRGEAVEEFNDYTRKAFDDYFKYLESSKAEFDAYASVLKRTWGSDCLESTRTSWIEYSPDNNDRSIVDFDKGEITIEAILPENASEADAEAELLAAVERLLKSRGTTCPYPSAVERAEPLTEEPILDGLVDMSGYKVSDDVSAVKTSVPSKPAPPKPTVKGKNIEVSKTPVPPVPAKPSGSSVARKKLEEKAVMKEEKERKTELAAKAIVEQAPKVVKEVKGDDGKERKVVSVKVGLVADNLSKNAALYKDIVAEYSDRFDIEQPLIYAVMEQESRFNPEAKSWVPAYGLMQLVATSGGFDAYRYVYGKEWVPTQSYLYNPRNNIELGTAYLRILMNQFAKVTDENCRRLCVIAGYNTGAGNVSRAFTGKTSVKTAVPMINEHNYNSLYNHLTSRLSTEEARNYVSGVSKRREKYIKQ